LAPLDYFAENIDFIFFGIQFFSLGPLGIFFDAPIRFGYWKGPLPMHCYFLSG